MKLYRWNLSKPRLVFVILAAALIAGLGVSAGLAASTIAGYSQNWNVTAAGGQISTGGGYTLGGTVGQVTNSQTMTGSSYTLNSGFWVGTYPNTVFLPRVTR